MASNRLELHQLLKSQFSSQQEPHVYFQPPQNIQLVYPCMIYKITDLPQIWANNLPYHWDHAYHLTYLTRDPNDPVVEKLIALRKTKFGRYYTADNLHHFTFTIFD